MIFLFMAIFCLSKCRRVTALTENTFRKDYSIVKILVTKRVAIEIICRNIINYYFTYKNSISISNPLSFVIANLASKSVQKP